MESFKDLTSFEFEFKKNVGFKKKDKMNRKEISEIIHFTSKALYEEIKRKVEEEVLKALDLPLNHLE